MKVEVITLHRVTNFGSLLQTYATQKSLERLGHQVEVVDFVPEGLSFYRAVWPKGHSTVKRLIKLLPLMFCNVMQYAMSDSFLRKYINLTQKCYGSYAQLAEDVPVADVYLSGSDQVWNTQNSNPPADLGAYYLAFTGDKKRVAYAGSFCKDDFSPEETALVTNWLKEYAAISVREDTALNTLSKFGLEGVHVVDPTLLLTPEDWKQLCTKKAPKPGYVFIYNLNRNKVLEQAAVAIAKEKGLRVVNFADTFEFVPGAENRFGNDPLDFINYLSKADYVVTDSFHGTAFSLNFSKQVLSIPAPKYNCRLESVLRMTGCEDRMFTTVDEALEKVEMPIDYAVVQEKLNNARVVSLDYLKEALKEQ